MHEIYIYNSRNLYVSLNSKSIKLDKKAQKIHEKVPFLLKIDNINAKEQIYLIKF